MNKTRFIIGLIALTVSVVLLSHSPETRSQENNPDDSSYAFQCGADATGKGTSACCVDFNEAMDAAKRDFQNSLQNLIGSERPASDMVDDAYENLRTYNCWLEYICRSVLYSGYAPIESAIGTGLTSDLIGQVPGCQNPEDIEMQNQWNGFLETMQQVPIVGVVATDKDGNLLGDGTAKPFLADNKFNFFPRCMTDPTRDNANPQLTLADGQFQECKRSLEMRFGIREDQTELQSILATEDSNAFVAVETALKKAHADQKGAALENKLNMILPKLHQMEEHVGYLTNYLTELGQRLACYAAKCD